MKCKYTYDRHDTSFLVNQDPSLTPIRIKLPTPPSLNLIDGYGKPPEEQRFERIEMPEKLKRLEQLAIDECVQISERYKSSTESITPFKIQRKFWDLLEKDEVYYKEEIAWIKKQWWHRIYGYWFFNKGKPTYIDGWHYMFLNYFKLPELKEGPEYRDVDRKIFLFQRYCYTTTESFEYEINPDTKKPKLKRDENGYPIVVDLERRTSFGSINTKFRRRGDTIKAVNVVLDICSMTVGTQGGGIMSYTADNAREHFEVLMSVWQNWPIFFKPYSDSKITAQSLDFNVPGNEYIEKGLGTYIDYAKTPHPNFYDGKKKVATLMDEEGKSGNIPVAVGERWATLKDCHSLGGGKNIIGFSIHPSTVEDYTDSSFQFKQLVESSDFYERVPETGQTASGLFRYFIGAAEGLEGSIDSYGQSVSYTVQPHQKKEGFRTSAYEFLNAQREFYKNEGLPSSSMNYRKFLKKFPLFYKDSWLGEAGVLGFPLEKIDKRLYDLGEGEKKTIKGNFELDGQGGARWVPRDDGRFEVSDLFNKMANRKRREWKVDEISGAGKEIWAPMWSGKVAGADPYRFSTKSQYKIKQEGDKLSDGGFAVYWRKDNSIDNSSDPGDWQSDKLVCTYKYRHPTDDQFARDCLAACVWYGAIMYSERNISSVIKYFIQTGYEGYLGYQVDDKGNVKSEPGIYLDVKNKGDGFNLLRNHLELRAHVTDHVDFLKEAKAINDMEELTKYDLLAAVMYALLGAESRYNEMLTMSNQTVSIDISQLEKIYGF